MPPILMGALSLAPYLARWVIGPQAQQTTEAVVTATKAVFGTDDPTEVQAAMEAHPDKRAAYLVELAQIDRDREAAEHARRVEELRIAAADRADARQMARSGTLAWGAGLVTAAAFALLAALGAVLALVDVPAGNREVLLMLGGTVAGMAGAAAQFWVGSSAGSAGKSGLIGAPFAQRRETVP